MPLIALILLSFSQLVIAASGEELYKNNCEKCHGLDRLGSIGLPLNKEKIAYFSDHYISQTIKNGRPGRVMPAFDLPESDIMRIIAFLRADLPPARRNTIRVSGDAKNGQELYQNYCFTCHHSPLIGGQGVGKNHSWKKDLTVAPPALGNPGFLAAVSDAEIKRVIRQSYPGSEMPSFQRILTSTEVSDIISYLRSFEQQATKEQHIEKEHSFVFDSPYDLNTTVEKMQNTLKAANFRVYAPRKLLQDLTDAPDIYSKQVVVRFCNFERMLEFLKIEPRLGIVLPCRVTIIETDTGEVKVVIENYKKTIAKFNNNQLLESSEELVTQLAELIEEALW